VSDYHRVLIQGGCYFFTVVTLDRTPIFINEDRVEILRQAFRKVMATRPFQIDAIVVLPEHLPCIWRLPEGDADYSSRWRELIKAVSRQICTTINERNERMIWQRRFWEHAIRDEDDWRKHVDYIHYNPVKHGLVSQPSAWKWSSFSRAVTEGWYETSWGANEPTTIVGMNCE